MSKEKMTMAIENALTSIPRAMSASREQTLPARLLKQSELTQQVREPVRKEARMALLLEKKRTDSATLLSPENPRAE